MQNWEENRSQAAVDSSYAASYPLISVVMPSYNSISLLQNAVRSVLSTRYPRMELIVVDDCSSDGSFEYLKQIEASDKRLRVIRNPQRSGPSLARNVGISDARGEYVAFLETDTEVDPDWLTEPVAVLRADPSIAAVQSRCLDLLHRDRIVSMGILLVPHTGWTVSVGFGKPAESYPDRPFEVTCGAVGTVVRKRILVEVGGFDEKLVHNVDDIDLFWRIWLTGSSIVSVPESVTYHWGSKPQEVRAAVTSRIESELHTSKMLRVFLKNYEAANVVRYLPVAVLAMFLRGILNMIRRDTVPIRGFIKGLAWNLKELDSTLRERYRIQETIRRVSDEYVMKKIMTKGSLAKIFLREILMTLKKSSRSE